MRYNPAIDGIRALGALFVLAFHARLPGMSQGHIGVDIFFVLSGYLITKLLVNEYRNTASINIIRFELRRMARLYPSLLLVLTIVALVIFVGLPKYSPFAEFFYPAFYISNFTMMFKSQPIVTQHTWSLSAEAQFYLLWPFIIFAIARYDAKRLLHFLIIIFLAATAWRFALLHQFGSDAGRIYVSLDGRFSSLALGGVLALVTWRPAPRLALAMSVGAIIVLTVFANGSPYSHAPVSSYPATFVELATGALILASTCEGNGFNRFLGSAPLARIGLWSYGIYLWHYPIARIMRKIFDGYTSFAITLAASLLLAALSYEFFERRMTKALQRKIAERSAPVIKS